MIDVIPKHSAVGDPRYSVSLMELEDKLQVKKAEGRNVEVIVDPYVTEASWGHGHSYGGHLRCYCLIDGMRFRATMLGDGWRFEKVKVKAKKV